MTYAPSQLQASPLLLDGSLHETIWGGRRLADVAGKHLPDGALIGESWETAMDSVVRNAPYAGETLGAVVERNGEALLGWRAVEVFGRRFPLLTKFLDAQQQEGSSNRCL
jgi:mannose-6-phosphate isomerase